MNRSGASGCSCAARLDAIRVCGRPNLRRDAAAASISANGPRAKNAAEQPGVRQGQGPIRPRRRGQKCTGHAGEFLALRLRPAALVRAGQDHAKYVNPEQLGDQGLALGQGKRNEPGVGDEFQGKGEQLANLPSLTCDPVLRVGANDVFAGPPGVVDPPAAEP